MKIKFLSSVILLFILCRTSIGQETPLDQAFGTAGAMPFSISGISLHPDDVICTINSKVVTAGTYFSDDFETFLFIAKQNEDGTNDISFSEDGFFSFNIPNFEVNEAKSINELSDGSLVVLLDINLAQSETSSLALLKLDSNGELDVTFNNQGWLVFNTSLGSTYAGETSILYDNFIYVFGSGTSNDSNPFYFVSKLDNNGTFISSFGNNGILEVSYESSQNDNQINELSDAIITDLGLITLCGNFNVGSDLILLQFGLDGTPHELFGDDGISIIESEYQDVEISSITVNAQGELILTGGRSYGFQTKPLLVKLNSDGQIDMSFGLEGFLSFESIEFQYSGIGLESFVDLESNIYVTIGGQSGYYSVVKMSNEGNPNVLFGTNGIYSYELDGTQIFARCATRQDNQRIVLSGWSNSVPDRQCLAIAILLDSVSSIEGGNQLTKAHLYPNPSDGSCNVDWNGPFSIEIFDATGHLCFSRVTNNDIEEIVVTTSGIYTVLLRKDGHRSEFLKLIVK